MCRALYGPPLKRRVAFESRGRTNRIHSGIVLCENPMSCDCEMHDYSRSKGAVYCGTGVAEVGVAVG